MNLCAKWNNQKLFHESRLMTYITVFKAIGYTFWGNNSVIFILASFRNWSHLIYPTALRKAKIVYNFGLSESNRVKESLSSVRANSCLKEPGFIQKGKNKIS